MSTPLTSSPSSSSGTPSSAPGGLPTLLRWAVDNRRPFIVLLHLGLAALSSYIAIWLRFDGDIAGPNWDVWVRVLPLLLVARALAFGWFRLYQGLWLYTSVSDLRNIVGAVLVSSGLLYPLVHWGLGLTAYPRSVFLIDAGVLVFLLAGVRLTRRLVTEWRQPSGERRVLIYGAGDAGELIVREMRATPRHLYEPVGFIDDDPTKTGLRIHGVQVLGTRDDLSTLMATVKPAEVLVAIPRADPAVFRQVVGALDRYHVPIKTLPSLREILDDKVEVSQIRNVLVEDLLSRGPANIDPTPVRTFLAGRRILVTGAGGSIGTELCSQVAAFAPTTLVLFDHAENGLFHLTNTLADRGHTQGIHAVVGDVTDRARVEQILEQHRIEIVFHAAAHKHVPLMEDNVCETVKNNVTGTRIMAEAAERFGVDRFVLISTDKAVNATSVMGATKRVGELLLQAKRAGSGTTFLTVRFGNVLGSSGSVVPRFRQQIKAGGPVTVTHPEIRRFFMLIPEAVQLVLQAAALGGAGKLYVLKMGNQINVAEMARNLIRLSGFIPDEEIPITFVGLRPGEKLFEELVGADEHAAPSPIEQVLEVTRPDGVAPALEEHVEALERVASQNDTDAVIAKLGDIVPAFHRNRQGHQVAAVVPETVPASTRQTRAAASSRLPTGQVCPACASDAVYRSRIKGLLERTFRKALSTRPYRCQGCGWRGWLTPIELFHARVSEPTKLAVPDLSLLDQFESLDPPGEVSPRGEVEGVAPKDDQPAFAPRKIRRA